jgi:DNA-binding response OmpR family regulator
MMTTATNVSSPQGSASILVVDDEAHLAEGIRENLEAEGYAAEVAHDGAEGLERNRNRHFDLVVLDVMMPNMDGLELCAQIRREGRQTPVLFLTVKNDVADRVRGFEAGGDDYLSKPFHLKELLLRVAAILRRSSLNSVGDSETSSPFFQTSWVSSSSSMSAKTRRARSSLAAARPDVRRSTARIRATISSRENGLVT